jgi:hypothetical protein
MKYKGKAIEILGEKKYVDAISQGKERDTIRIILK